MPILLAIGAWLVPFWTSLSAAIIAVITTRFAVAVFLGVFVLAAWGVMAVALKTIIEDVLLLLDTPVEIADWLVFLTPPALLPCLGALVAAYVLQVGFRLLVLVVRIKSGG